MTQAIRTREPVGGVDSEKDLDRHERYARLQLDSDQPCDRARHAQQYSACRIERVGRVSPSVKMVRGLRG